jgi:hypothetical protein
MKQTYNNPTTTQFTLRFSSTLAPAPMATNCDKPLGGVRPERKSNFDFVPE